jgi:hypothetical protein
MNYEELGRCIPFEVMKLYVNNVTNLSDRVTFKVCFALISVVPYLRAKG